MNNFSHLGQWISAALFLFFLSCSLTSENKPDPDTTPVLKLIDTFDLEILEPSGLTFDPDSNCLWCVSDQTGKIYQMDFQGNTLQILPFVGSDLEGIACDNNSNCLWIVEETERNLVKVSMEGYELERFQQIIPGNDNSGLEGVCLDDNFTLFLLKEKNPGQFIELKSDYSVKSIITLGFAGDYSGIVHDSSRAGFWIVSDQSEHVYLWDQENGVREQYSLSFPKAEGIAFVQDTGLFYLVSDSENKLYVFQINYSE